MLVLFAAASLAAAPVAPPVKLALLDPPRGYVYRTGPPKVCKAAGRMQTSLAEPALLFRPQDRAAARPRILARLPPAEMCLLGGAYAPTEASR